MKFKALFYLFIFVLMGACKTSGDLHSEGNNDPGHIRTVVNPVYANAQPRDPAELEKELAITRGQLEEVKYTSELEKRELLERISKLEESNAQLIQELEKLQWSGFAANTGTGDSADSAELMWKKAVENLETKNYDRAYSLFDAFVKTHPKDKGTFYAKIAMAMIQYNQGKFRQSLISFNKVIDNYNKHERISLAWFGQGVAFAKNGQSNDAKLFFEETTRISPKSTEAKISKSLLSKKVKPPEDIFSAVSDWDKGAPYTSGT